MENSKNIEKLLVELRKAVDTLILVELCKSGAGQKEIREIRGSLDNNLFTKINNAVKKKEV